MAKAVLIIPTYNSTGTLKQTLESIWNQGNDLTLLEKIVIADDASKDDTLEIVRDMPQIPIPVDIHTAAKNRGEYANVNSAVMSLEPEIEWYLVMHSDNLAKPGWIRELATHSFAAPENVGSVCTSYDTLFLDARTVSGEGTGNVNTFPGNAKSVYDALRAGCWWHNSTASVRVKAFRQIGGMPARQDLSQMGDWDFSLRLMASGWAITYISKSLMVYRENEQSVSSKNFVVHKDIIDRAKVTERFSRGCPQEVIKFAHRQMFTTLLRRTVSSALRLQGKRFLSAFRAMGIVLDNYRRCRLLRSQPFVPPTHAVVCD